jgi:2-polyprenyl-3-methyl-5-hydroxy-6-metoxy-1,4-benzoquinol methylase
MTPELNDQNPLPFEPLPVFRAFSEDPALADNRGKRIGILIVTYNAVTTLAKVLKRITPDVWKNVEEIAVFDDASQDSTFELAVGLKALRRLPKLQVLKHEKNLGYGGNQKAGYKYFIEKGFDVVVLLHGDGQYAPEILSRIYAPLIDGRSDAVFGSRMMRTYGGPLKGGMPLYKYIGNRILSTFENWSLGLSLTEFHSGYRAYSLDALRQIDFSRMTDDFHFDTEIIIKLHYANRRILEVPIPTYYGKELCYVDGLRYARNVYKSIRRYKKVIQGRRCFPEFEEYFVHYQLKQFRYSSHYYAIQIVGRDQTVLDIGCGGGLLAAELSKEGNRVVGIDAISGEVAAVERYYRVNLEEGLDAILPEVEAKSFTRILLLDVLEHLTSPERIIEQCHQLLAGNGKLIVSLPNIANISVRLMLLAGRFNYTDRGILDRTHFRFFTRASARGLLMRAGYRIIAEKTTNIPLDKGLGLAPGTVWFNAVNWMLHMLTSLWPSLFGYQFVLVAEDAGRRV